MRLRECTALAVAARNAGIAAIAASRGFIVASRHTSPCEAGKLSGGVTSPRPEQHAS
jgi:hypothetical protein